MTIKRITCNSSIEAEGFRSALHEAGIESVAYDETNSKVARGILDKTTEIFVKEEDYDRASKMYQAYQSEHDNVIPWCPKCGSENLDYASRVIGYLTLISAWSMKRQEEAKRRYYAHGMTVLNGGN